MEETEPEAYLMATSAETLDLLRAIEREMTDRLGVGRAEAVARINHRWCGLDLSGEDEIILHEDEYYWALGIYFTEVWDWRPEADRSEWTARPAPEAGSRYWTV
ncbi:hypothetical protein [Streptomyces sp. NPDC059708]|uniref:hypothetical protein n=1 Tax=Streptomyces sp. NPDC059708 TaxID=3346916 RepID=UPI0036775579